MKKTVTIMLCVLLYVSALISPVSAELKIGYKDYDNGHKYEYKYEDIGDFRYIYEEKSTYVEVLYKKASSKQEIKRIEFPAEYKGKKIDYIGFIGLDNDPKVKNLKVNTIFIPKTIDRLPIDCVDNPDFDEPRRLISLRNIEVDKDNPYLCSKDGVLYSNDMKELKLYPNRNSMTVYKMPNSVEEAYDLKKRNNIRKLYLSDNLKIVWYNFARNCKKLEYVRIGKNTTNIWEKAFYANKKLKTVKIKSKKLKSINSAAFGYCKSLKKISLPSSVKKIDEFAFGGCKNLSKVYINNKKKSPKVKCYAFENTKKGIKFYVKNKKVAKSLKKQLKGSGVKNAKILVGKKVIYKNVK